MNRNTFSALALAITAVAAAPAHAVDTTSGPVTREQVRAELADARRTGDLVDADTGRKFNELYPTLYPQKPAVQAKTREQVKAELAEAIRTGDIVGNGESGQKLNEMYPNRYPKKAAAQGLTREQVKAELAEALRTGDIVGDVDSGMSLKQMSPGLYPRKAVTHAAQSDTGTLLAGK